MAGNIALTAEEDFDFNNTCRYFKSSFARTLSLNNGSNCCRSLDFDIVYQQHDKKNININNNNNKNDHSLMNDHIRIKNANATKIDYGLSGGELVRQQRITNMDIDAKNEVVIMSNDEIGMTTNQNNIMKPIIIKTNTTNQTINNNNNKNNNIDNTIIQQMNTSVQPQSLPLILRQQQQQKMSTHFEPNCNFMSSLTAKNEIPTTILTRSETKEMTSGTRRVGKTDAIERDGPLIDKTSYAAGIQPILMVNNNINNNNNNNNNNNTNNNNVKNKPMDMAESTCGTVNVETVLLRNQVDTLQWQLKQVETSCEMYHAVMEEVSRFLERYQKQKQQQRINYNNILEQQQKMSRSKSLYQVYGVNAACHEKSQQPLCADEAQHNAVSYLRARSSTNLIDLNAKPALPTLPALTIDRDSFSAFKDFTWRRSPKKTSGINGAGPAGPDDIEEKLCQEAFRLSRTIQNLLDTSTKQPDLTQHRNSLSSLSLGRTGAKVVVNSSSATNPNDCENLTLAKAAVVAANQDTCGNAVNVVPKTNKNSLSAVADILFLRSNTMRDSRLSVRSSTDSSVHSTISSTSSSSASASSSSCTSSKLETDEDTMVNGMNQQTNTTNTMAVNGSGGSTTEDESGFSSINSFQDIGVPAFSSTLIERKPTLKVSMRPKSMILNKHPNNILGLPDTPTHMWEVPAATTIKTSYHNANKFHRFSTLSTEEAGTVLWV